ncbi:hypothetical protein AYI69_g5544, partial [Smittium culicis]
MPSQMAICQFGVFLMLQIGFKVLATNIPFQAR